MLGALQTYTDHAQYNPQSGAIHAQNSYYVLLTIDRFVAVLLFKAWLLIVTRWHLNSQPQCEMQTLANMLLSKYIDDPLLI